MANKAVILTANQDRLPPDEVLETAAKGHTAIGTAFMDNGELIVQKQSSPFTTATVKELHDQTKAVALVTIFQQMETPIDEANIQPFEEKEDTSDGGTLTHLAVFVEGELPKYGIPKQPQTAERDWFEKAFLPLVKAYVETDKEPSIAGCMTYLRTQAVTGALKSSLGERGVIKVFAETGDILTIEKGESLTKGEWGDVSFSKEKEAPTTAKVTSLFSKGKAKTEDAPAPSPSKEPEPKKDDKTIIHQSEPEKKTETAVGVTGAYPPPPEGRVWARPVHSVRSHNKSFKKELQSMIGGLPKGWPTMEWFAVEKTKLPHKKWELKDQGAISSALEKAKNGKEFTAEDARKGLVPDGMQKDFKDKFLPSIQKYVETPNLPTMEELQADENKHPTWYDKTGIHIQDSLNLPPNKLEELDRDYHALYVLRMRALTNLVVKSIHEHPPKTQEVVENTIVEKTGTSDAERKKNLANLNKDLVKSNTKSLFRKTG